MKKRIITYLAGIVFSLLTLTGHAQITRTPGQPSEPALSGVVYKVTARNMVKYRENALTVMQNFYNTLPDCGDADVKENFIENMMEPTSMFMVDFYRTNRGITEFLAPSKYILEFAKEYKAELKGESEFTFELTDVKFDKNLVHPEGDEHAVLLQLYYYLTIRYQDKVLTKGRSSAICYFQSRTDFRTCKVRQISPVLLKNPVTSSKIRVTTNKGERKVKRRTVRFVDKTPKDTVPAPPGNYRFNHFVKKGETLKAISLKYDITLQELLDANPELKQRESIRIGQQLRIPYPTTFTGRVINQTAVSSFEDVRFVTMTYHPDFRISKGAISHYKNEHRCVIDLLVENIGQKDVQIQAYHNIHKSKFKLRVVDNEGNVYENVTLRTNNNTNIDHIRLAAQTFVKVSVEIPNLSATAKTIQLIEWEMYCNEWNLHTSQPITIKNIVLPY